MPYKSEKARIAGTSFDRRRKLDEGDKAQILRLREQDGMSYNRIAKVYGVSKSLIILICNPDRAARCREQFKERRKDGRYYDRETNRESVKNSRRYKERLVKSGAIRIEEDVEDLGQ